MVSVQWLSDRSAYADLDNSLAQYGHIDGHFACSLQVMGGDCNGQTVEVQAEPVKTQEVRRIPERISESGGMNQPSAIDGTRQTSRVQK